MENKVKITVVKKMTTEDLYGKDVPIALSETFIPDCPRFKLGDEFIVPEDGSCPSRFCSWAYADIQRDITHLRFGGSFPWSKDKKSTVACCTDGLRTVFFKLEKME